MFDTDEEEHGMLRWGGDRGRQEERRLAKSHSYLSVVLATNMGYEIPEPRGGAKYYRLHFRFTLAPTIELVLPIMNYKLDDKNVPYQNCIQRFEVRCAKKKLGVKWCETFQRISLEIDDGSPALINARE
jgi:hypothetical protein